MDHAANLTKRLENLRRIFEWKCSGVDHAGGTATVGASTLTLNGLLKHVALVEDDYFTLRLMGRPLPEPWNTIELTQVADWAWKSAADDQPDELLELWRAAVARSRSATDEALAEGGLERAVIIWPRQPPATLERILTDMIEEYARHCGHADLIRESVDGLVGEDPPS
jgi:uncharacterized damage-inducible protein DinB